MTPLYLFTAINREKCPGILWRTPFHAPQALWNEFSQNHMSALFHENFGGKNWPSERRIRTSWLRTERLWVKTLTNGALTDSRKRGWIMRITTSMNWRREAPSCPELSCKALGLSKSYAVWPSFNEKRSIEQTVRAGGLRWSLREPIMASHGTPWHIMAHHGPSWPIMAHHGSISYWVNQRIPQKHSSVKKSDLTILILLMCMCKCV